MKNKKVTFYIGQRSLINTYTNENINIILNAINSTKKLFKRNNWLNCEGTSRTTIINLDKVDCIEIEDC